MSSRRPFLPLVLIVAAIVASSAGCLSLGGKTTYVTEGAETSSRINALESRVASLEQMLGKPSPSTVVTPPAVPPASSF